MSTKTLNGIVLRATDYRDNDRILSLFTKEKGMVTVSARGCRKPKSKYAAFSDQFCYGEVVVSERNGKAMLSGASVLESFYSIRESYEQLLSATVVVTLVEKVAPHDTPNDELFILCYHALSLIAYGNGNPHNIELCFIAKLLKAMGYAPILTSCVKCGIDLRRKRHLRFSNSQGGSICESCGSAFRTVSALSLEAFRRMMLLDSIEMGKVVLPEQVRIELTPLIYDYAEYTLDCQIHR